MHSFGRILAYALLGLWAVISLLPLYWIFVTALIPPSVVLALPPKFLPIPFTPVNFQRLLNSSQVLRWTFNSLFVSSVVTASNVLLGTMAGYVLAKKRFPGNTLIFWLVVSTMLVPGQITIIPLYDLIVRLNWINTYTALIVPGLVGPFAIFLMKQFLQTLPGELLDAARIDGCSELRTFWDVVIPLSLPGMAVLAIFTFMGTWNDFLWPLIVTNKEEMMTLQIGLTSLQNVYFTDYGLLMAGAAFAAVPMIVVFLVFQPAFVRGITIGALKG
jgi:multiple sugar transport system permease protein